MKHRDKTIYTARFSQIRLNAFGIERTLPYEASIEIYQARVSPELWRARPMFEHSSHKWEASSAIALQEIVESDFIEKLSPWTRAEHAPVVPRPSLRSAAPRSAEERAS